MSREADLILSLADAAERLAINVNGSYELRLVCEVRALVASRDVVFVARCAEHGLHGERQECFVCGERVEQVPMLELSAKL